VYDSAARYRVFYAACIAAMSVSSLVHAHGARDHHAWLAVVECVGAVLLVPRRTRRTGLVVLLAVFTVAIVLTLHARALPMHLVLYAGTTIFVAQRSVTAPAAPLGPNLQA
jgi:hypothetical protein